MSEVRRDLDRIRALAIADALLLVALLVGVVADIEWISPVVGPIHGIGFLGLLVLTAKGAGEGKWGWWFPLITFVTTGPPGSLIGDLKIRRQGLRPSRPRPEDRG